jgi:uncharacterized protein YkwD
MQPKKIVTLCLLNMLVFSVVPAQIPSERNPYTDIDYRKFRNERLFNEEIDFNHIDFKIINAVVFHLTNEIRAKYNLKLLTYATELEMSSMLHAQDMINMDFFSHINEKDNNKRTPNDRAKLCHITNPYLAENIIEGYGLRYKAKETVYIRGLGQFSKTDGGVLLKPHSYLSLGEAVILDWMNSKDHRKNILSKDMLQLGCGAAFYINQKFNDMPSFLVVQNFQMYELIVLLKP